MLHRLVKRSHDHRPWRCRNISVRILPPPDDPGAIWLRTLFSMAETAASPLRRVIRGIGIRQVRLVTGL
ncbi:MAG TPA: hypothetical protein DDW72_06770, partial [Afipia sp.]|nr:hypothetical protein [Afipia sp.]